MATWISAVSSLVLVGVTTWYAYLTWRMSSAALLAAQASERAAQAAADSLSLERSLADVAFQVALTSPLTWDSSRHVVTIGSLSVGVLAGSCTVASIMCDSLGRTEGTGMTWLKLERGIPLLVDGPVDVRSDSPVRVAAQASGPLSPGGWVDAIRLRIDYSVAGSEMRTVYLKVP